MGRIVGLTINPPVSPTTYTCPDCGKEYKTVEGLNKHVDKEHPISGERNAES